MITYTVYENTFTFNNQFYWKENAIPVDLIEDYLCHTTYKLVTSIQLKFLY